jgi:hypothetical protein
MRRPDISRKENPRMTNPNVRTEEEIEDLLATAYEVKDEGGSRYPGMSFEDGITETLEWIKGDREENPLEEN